MKKILSNNNIHVEIDETTGYIIRISKNDSSTNWVLDNSTWGKVENFTVETVENIERGVKVLAQNESETLRLSIRREITDEAYLERYVFINASDKELTITQETFAIYFPFNCAITKAPDFLEELCTAHVWCGGNTAWLYGERLAGGAPFLIVNMTEGDCSDYSVSRDIVRKKACDYRGDLLLNPTPRKLKRGQSFTMSFAYFFSDELPQIALSKQEGFLSAYADKYTAHEGEEIELLVACPSGLHNLSVTYNDEALPFTVEGNEAKIVCLFTSKGEKKINIYANGKYTYVYVNIVEDTNTLYEQRTRFIVDKQQYHQKDNPLDGAYLCYDDDTKTTYFDNERPDFNAGRERICMGIVVLLQLQQKHDEALMKSIEKHREFVERELFDENDGMVYNEIQRDNSWLRIFNFPWFSIYYFEWYVLTGNLKYLKNSAKILLKYYQLDGAKQNSQMIEAVTILEQLKLNQQENLYEALKREFLYHCDTMIELDSFCQNNECGYISEYPTVLTSYMSQAYILTGDEKYKSAAAIYEPRIHSFYSFQPDYHLNSITVRHWERYWFGKKDEYCDTMPQQWTCLISWAYKWYDEAFKTNHKKLIKDVIYNSLCLYREDGFAANVYAPAYKTTVYSSVKGYTALYTPTGVFYGKNYDERANDQDWILYFLKTCL